MKAGLQAAKTLELCMDASRFSTRDTEITEAFAYDGQLPDHALVRPMPTGLGGNLHGFAAKLPPQTHRELRWRKGEAGCRPSREDLEVLSKNGMRACPGMATRDYLQMVNSILKHAGKHFASFICSPLQRMGARELRFWCPSRSGW